jgi:8-oxo-dGTP pyrophosphatase MutT (NUDIX family)
VPSDAPIDVVALVVADGGGRWLQIRRGAAVTYPGRLCFPGGTVEPDEAIATALIRESAEELGLTAVPQRELTVATLGDVTVHAWECDVSGALVPDRREVAEVLWLTTSQIMAHPDAMPSSLIICAALGRSRST